jgi:hypothetical protein
MNIETYNLPAFWASALINGDTTDMEDEDEAAMNAWFDATFPNGAHCVDCSSEEDDDAPGFTRWHDASQYVLACDCLTYSFDVSAVAKDNT